MSLVSSKKPSLPIKYAYPNDALRAPSNERIIGLYGRSWWGENFDSIAESVIITAARVDLLGIVYNKDELRNTNGGQYVR